MFGLRSKSGFGFRAQYARDGARYFARPIDAPLLAESHLAPLPPAIQRYIRRTGSAMDGLHRRAAQRLLFCVGTVAMPLSDYRAFGARRLMACGQGVWHPPEGAYAYLRFDLDAIDYNVSQPS